MRLAANLPQSTFPIALRIFRLGMYFFQLVTVCTIIILPWSIFLFVKFYDCITSSQSHQIIVPLNFDYQYINQPPFVSLSLRQSKLLDLLDSNQNYDVYLDFEPYCGSTISLNQDSINVSPITQSHKVYSIKASLVNSSLTSKLWEMYHRDANEFPYSKKTPQTTCRERSHWNSWPLTRFMTLEIPSLYTRDHTTHNPQYQTSLTQSFLVDCLSYQSSMDNPIIPPILKHFVPPMFYSLGVPKLSYLTASSLWVFPKDSQIEVKLFSHLMFAADAYDKFIETDLILEFNDLIQINNFNSRLILQKSPSFMDTDYGWYKAISWIIRNQATVYFVGISITFMANVFIYLICVILSYYWVNENAYNAYVVPMLNAILEQQNK